MFCQNCGNKLDGSGRFCAVCGKAILPPQQKKNPRLPLLLGLLLLVGGLLPLFLHFGADPYAVLVYELHLKNYSYHAISALAALRNFAAWGESFLSFCCSGFCVLTGALLLKCRHNSRRMLLLTAVFLGLQLLRSTAVALIITAAPRWVMSLFVVYEPAIDHGILLLEQESGILSALLPHFWVRLLLAGALLGLCIFGLIKGAKSLTRPRYGTLGIALMLPMVTFASSLVQNAFSMVLANTKGDMAVAACSLANAAFSRYVGTACALLLCLWILLAVFTAEKKAWITVLPAVGTVLLLSAVACLMTETMLAQMDTPKEVYVMALERLFGLILNALVMLIALFLWFNAVAKQRLPLWLQILLPVALPLICIFWEGITVSALQWDFGFSFGLLRCAWILSAISLLVRKRTAIA